MNLNPARPAWSAPAVGYLLSSISLLAHPGHDWSEATPEHLLTSPDHLAVLALGGAALWLAGRLVKSQLPGRLLQSAGLVAVLTAAVIWGIRL